MNDLNIAVIYGFETSGVLHAPVMELVEGDDLSQRIARGAVPIDEALPIAKQKPIKVRRVLTTLAIATVCMVPASA